MNGAGELERLFWLLFERTSNPVALIDERRCIVDLNTAAAELFGRPRVEAIGISIYEALPPADRVPAERDWQTLLRTGELARPGLVQRADGSHLAIEFAARLATIGGRRLAIFVLLSSRVTRPSGSSAGAGAGELSDREREVVALIALGLETPQIAERLYISPATVRTHVRNAMSRLAVHTRAQLVAVALRGDAHLTMGDVLEQRSA